MKIFDCFKFFNELELLDLRLMVLDELVDYFVLVEANKTHTGKEKEFIFEQNKHKFSSYLDRIIYVKVEDLPDYIQDDIWVAENFQRDCITRGLDIAEVGDKIIISDVDEIPNPDTIKKYLNSNEPVTMTQYLFYYYVNCLQRSPWWGSILATYGKYESPQELRNMARGLGYNAVPNGGWHYSFMGGPERIKLKVENIAESHLIIDSVGTIYDIERKMKTQKDLWNRTDYNSQKSIIDINIEGAAPRCINQFIEKHPEFFFKTAGRYNE
jgi:beta-1,4-mannosyl-glycoprotein beta-1,4-N-acetylglucosaminyltransferase